MLLYIACCSANLLCYWILLTKWVKNGKQLDFKLLGIMYIIATKLCTMFGKAMHGHLKAKASSIETILTQVLNFRHHLHGNATICLTVNIFIGKQQPWFTGCRRTVSNQLVQVIQTCSQLAENGDICCQLFTVVIGTKQHWVTMTCYISAT